MPVPSQDASVANIPLGELVLAKSLEQDGDALRARRDDQLGRLPPFLREHAWAWLPAIEKDGLRAYFWRQLPEEAEQRLRAVALDAHEATRGVELTADDREALFWGVVFHFARRIQMSTEARMFVQNAVGESRYRRPFES